MARFNQWGQWSLDGDEKDLMFKTAEKRTKEAKPEELSKGKDIIGEQFANMDMSNKVDRNGNKLQPTDEELFGHLVVSKEQLEKKEQEWRDTFNKHFRGSGENVDHLNKSEKLDFEWEDGKSFNDYLSEKEVSERNKIVG